MVTQVPERQFSKQNLEEMRAIAGEVPTKAAKMRNLEAAGYSRGDIAAFLETSYQHVRNVLGKRLPPTLLARAASEAVQPPDERNWGALKLGLNGELTLPPRVMKALAIRPGARIGWSLDGDVLLLMGNDAGFQFVQDLAVNFSAEDEELVTDQFLKERRAEAAIDELKDELMHG